MYASSAKSPSTRKLPELPRAPTAHARLARSEICAEVLHLESASHVQLVLGVKIALVAPASQREAACHVKQATTRRRLEQGCVNHARLLHSVRPSRIAAAAAEPRKAPA